MHYWGKVIGLILGIVSGSVFWGIMSGLLLGHLFDKLSMLKPANVSGAARSGQGLFFITTFQVMGHLTKAKGRVTEADIQLASVIMDRMQLRGEIRMAAQQAFREGKQSGYPLREKLRIFRQACHSRIDLIRIFLEIQIQAALADGKLHPSERQILYVTAEELGISRQQFDIFLEMMTGGEPFTQHHYQYRHGGTTATQPTLQDACNVLGIRPEDDTATIKRAYRKRMNEHHPDKLVAKGLPKEMLEIAKEKAQKIQSAYDFLRQQKGFK